jgi:hypothetical protein
MLSFKRSGVTLDAGLSSMVVCTMVTTTLHVGEPGAARGEPNPLIDCGSE